jgi:hypothetical protein
MVAGLAEALKVDKKKPLIDAPIATALLTGIVAETDRFSNEHTTSKAMTVAATLMAAGADQQLIANELQAAQGLPETPDEDNSDTPDESDSDNDTDTDVEVDKDSDDGTMTIKKSHDPSALNIKHEGETLADLDRRVMGVQKAKLKVAEEVAVVQSEAAEEERQEQEEAQQEEQAPKEESKETLEEAPSEEPTLKAEPESPMGNAYQAEDDSLEPALGGTLNATSEQAAEDARRAAENDQNRTILSHSYLGGADEPAEAINATAVPMTDTPEGFPGTPEVAPGSVGMNGVGAPANEEVHSAYAPEDDPSVPSTGISGERVIQPLSDPTPAPTPMPSTSPYAPTPAPEPISSPLPPLNPTPIDLGLPLPPPLPDFSQINSTATPAIPLPPTQPPAILGDILAPEASAEPAVTAASLADPAPFNPTTNAVPAPNTAYAFEEPAPSIPPLGQNLPQPPQPPQGPADPTQFQIPPQQ